LPRTTTEILQDDDGGFPGQSLLDVTTDQTAIAEVIHTPNDVYEKTKRVYVNRPVDDPAREEIQHDIVLYECESKLTTINGSVEDMRGPQEIVSRLIKEANTLHSTQIRRPSGESEGYDEQTKRRLQRLGYLE
jgi:hypothetical protein